MPKAKKPKKVVAKTTAAAASLPAAAKLTSGARVRTVTATATPNTTVAGRIRGLRSQVSLSPNVIKNSDKILAGLRSRKVKKSPAQAAATVDGHYHDSTTSSTETGADSCGNGGTSSVDADTGSTNTDDEAIGSGTSRVPSDQAPSSTDHNDGEAQASHETSQPTLIQNEQLRAGQDSKLTRVDCYVADCPVDVALKGLILSREELDMIFAYRQQAQATLTQAHSSTDVCSPVQDRAPQGGENAADDLLVQEPAQRSSESGADDVPVHLDVGERNGDSAAPTMPEPISFEDPTDSKWIMGSTDLYHPPPNQSRSSGSNSEPETLVQSPPAQYQLPFSSDDRPLLEGIELYASYVDADHADVSMLDDSIAYASSNDGIVAGVGGDTGSKKPVYPSPSIGARHYVYGQWPPREHVTSPEAPPAPPATPATPTAPATPASNWDFLALPNVARGLTSTISSLLGHRRRQSSSPIEALDLAETRESAERRRQVWVRARENYERPSLASDLPQLRGALKRHRQQPANASEEGVTCPVSQDTRPTKRVRFSRETQTTTLEEVDRVSSFNRSLWLAKNGIRKKTRKPSPRQQSPPPTRKNAAANADLDDNATASIDLEAPTRESATASMIDLEAPRPARRRQNPPPTRENATASTDPRRRQNPPPTRASARNLEVPKTPQADGTGRRVFSPPSGASFGLSDSFYAYSSGSESESPSPLGRRPNIRMSAPNFLLPQAAGADQANSQAASQTMIPQAANGQITWTEAPPPTPSPAHAKLPSKRSEPPAAEVQAAALARARSQTELYKPVRPSGLRRVSILSVSTASSAQEAVNEQAVLSPLAVDLVPTLPDVPFSPSDPSGLGQDHIVNALNENWTATDDKKALMEWDRALEVATKATAPWNKF
ncbi:MAG: hypothetical protein M1839_000574 [Geoglossum umbratile]|nr:MAG: hypothetical protein M1839_000574 [Geoglossum umbratile]